MKKTDLDVWNFMPEAINDKMNGITFPIEYHSMAHHYVR
jgi:hypothetical protein